MQALSIRARWVAALAAGLTAATCTAPPFNERAFAHAPLLSPLAGIGAPVLPQAPGVVGPYLAAAFPDAFPVHGVDGDTRVLFVVSPDKGVTRPPGVYAAHRQTGLPLGAVPAPPVGWMTPLSLIVEEFAAADGGTQGTFLVLDAGGPPSEAGRVTTYIHRYRYAYAAAGGFGATWLETHRLPLSLPVAAGVLPSGIVYTDGFARLPGGIVAVGDAIVGAIWVSDESLQHWRLAMIDSDFAAGPGYVAQGTGRAPGGGTRPYTFVTPGSVFPGIHSMTYVERTDELCAVRTAPPGGIWCVSRITLLSESRPPAGKLKRRVVASRIGLSDATDGLAYDRYHPSSPWLYWARAFADEIGGGSNILRRVNLIDGRIEEVARSLTAYDFTSNLAALPPLTPARTAIVSAVGQQENNATVNLALAGLARWVGPTPVPIVELPFEG